MTSHEGLSLLRQVDRLPTPTKAIARRLGHERQLGKVCNLISCLSRPGDSSTCRGVGRS